MARPKKEKILQHGNRVYVRYSDAEYQLISHYAREAGYPIGVYVRKRSLGEKVAINYNIVADIEEIQKLTMQFSRIGSNLNQIAAYFNTGGMHSRAMQTEIDNCISELHELREVVCRMAGEYRGNLKTYHK